MGPLLTVFSNPLPNPPFWFWPLKYYFYHHFGVSELHKGVAATLSRIALPWASTARCLHKPLFPTPRSWIFCRSLSCSALMASTSSNSAPLSQDPLDNMQGTRNPTSCYCCRRSSVFGPHAWRGHGIRREQLSFALSAFSKSRREEFLPSHASPNDPTDQKLINHWPSGPNTWPPYHESI